MGFGRVIAAALVVAGAAVGLSAQPGSERIARIYSVDIEKREIVIASQTAGRDIKMGDILYAKVAGKDLQLRVIFPMQSVAKCRAIGENKPLWVKLIKDSLVFRFYPPETESTKVKTYRIGDTGPAGGLIFLDKGKVSDGWRYLEAAPEDISASVKWYKDKNVPVSTEDKIGTGKKNTAAIVSVQGEGVYAAKLCLEYRGAGFSDWFLPSQDELEDMCDYLSDSGKIKYNPHAYWSSSVREASEAWYNSFGLGGSPPDKKLNQRRVRAVRAF